MKSYKNSIICLKLFYLTNTYLMKEELVFPLIKPIFSDEFANSMLIESKIVVISPI